MATNQKIVDKAQQLYVSYYGRPADPGGLAFWIDHFTETSDVDQALDDFGNSAEFRTIRAANPASEGLINQLYQFMFNRDPEQEGLDFYSDLLDSGAASLAAVDDTSASVLAAKAAIPDQVETLNGFFTLTADTPAAAYSQFSVGVTVTLDGDDSETEFSVTGSGHDDTFILEEYLKATLDGGGRDILRGGAGNDTFVYEDETALSTETVDGQTGMDIIEFTADVINLSATVPTNVSIESLLLSNLEGESAVYTR